MLDSHFVLLGAAFSIAGGGSYIISTLRGKTRPNRVTFALWALAPLVAFAAEIGKGVGLQSLMTFMVGFMPLMVLIASLANNKARWKLTTFDYTCGLLSLVGLALWLVTREGNMAILFSIIADGLAALPTIVKAYRHPETENWLGFGGGAVNAGITLLTIKHWTFANYGFPLYILIVCLAISGLVLFSPRQQQSRQSA